jgi:hypothetical protein
VEVKAQPEEALPTKHFAVDDDVIFSSFRLFVFVFFFVFFFF